MNLYEGEYQLDVVFLTFPFYSFFIISFLSNPTHVFEFNWPEFRDFTERLQGWKTVKLFGQNILPPKGGDLILSLIPRQSHFNVIMTPGQYLPRFSRDFVAIMEKV